MSHSQLSTLGLIINQRSTFDESSKLHTLHLSTFKMQNHVDGLGNGVNGNGNGNRAGNQDRNYQNQYFNRLPNPRDVSFIMPDAQLEFFYATWAIAHVRVRQQLYNPEQAFAPFPRPPHWGEEVRAMMVLWIARERRLFELEMRETEYLLGLRGLR
ncbi:hypothetical protein EDD22DRAFT_849115 [Suillus occidentalis]|nr:hypothetical protein EDD22DRAFT_849115 [Suillus occidentalis]